MARTSRTYVSPLRVIGRPDPRRCALCFPFPSALTRQSDLRGMLIVILERATPLGVVPRRLVPPSSARPQKIASPRGFNRQPFRLMDFYRALDLLLFFSSGAGDRQFAPSHQSVSAMKKSNQPQCCASSSRVTQPLRSSSTSIIYERPAAARGSLLRAEILRQMPGTPILLYCPHCPHPDIPATARKLRPGTDTRDNMRCFTMAEEPDRFPEPQVPSGDLRERRRRKREEFTGEASRAMRSKGGRGRGCSSDGKGEQSILRVFTQRHHPRPSRSKTHSYSSPSRSHRAARVICEPSAAEISRLSFADSTAEAAGNPP